jgi:hypothetical protein
VDHELLELIDQNSAGALHHAFGQSCRARGVHDVVGVIERELNEIQGRHRSGNPEIAVMNTLGDARDVRFLPGVRNDHHFLDAREIFQDVGDALQGVHFLSLEPVPVRREENTGLDLTEPIQDPLDSEIRRTGRPGRPKTCRSEHGKDRLRHIRHEANDPVSGLYVHVLQGFCDPRDFFKELGIGYLPDLSVLT